MERTLSRPERIREVFRKHPGVILTRAEICEFVCKNDDKNWWQNPTEFKYLSMALSRMVQNGEVNTYTLLGKHGYCWRTPTLFSIQHEKEANLPQL